MEERGNKTIMCSVFFLDIVGYSKKSVTGQISLKERFNSYLSTAIKHVPAIDRIILDTGDGAAINFLGDIEDALKAALSLRENLLNEDPNREHQLLVRMGINLGPVRLVRDINGQPNIVGDGINVAQRVMGFADASQILVSRSYYDAVSRVSPHYAGMFHYQGSRTDKHVREHEVYAIGYPGDGTTTGRTARLFFERSDGPIGKAYAAASDVWRSIVNRDSGLVALLTIGFWQAKPMQRVLYVLLAVVPLLMLIIFLASLVDDKGGSVTSDGKQFADRPDESSVAWELARPDTKVDSGVAGKVEETNEPMLASRPERDGRKSTATGSSTSIRQRTTETPRGLDSQLQSDAGSGSGNNSTTSSRISEPVAAEPDVAAGSNMPSMSDVSPKPDVNRAMQVPETELKPKVKPKNAKPLTKSSDNPEIPVVNETPKTPVGSDAQLFVHCLDGSEIFIDGTRKGRISEVSITLDVSPGMHAVIVSHPHGVDSRNISFEAGKTVRISPDFCN